MDCHHRSKYTHPTKWLALTDIDEWFLPDPFYSTNALDNFLRAQNDSVASICINRAHSSRWPLRANAENTSARKGILELESFVTYDPPATSHAMDNHKCLYRSAAFEMPFIHWELSLRSRPNITNTRTRYREDTLPFKFVHNSRRWGRGPFAATFNRTVQFSRYLDVMKGTVYDLFPPNDPSEDSRILQD